MLAGDLLNALLEVLILIFGTCMKKHVKVITKSLKKSAGCYLLVKNITPQCQHFQELRKHSSVFGFMTKQFSDDGWTLTGSFSLKCIFCQLLGKD